MLTHLNVVQKEMQNSLFQILSRKKITMNPNKNILNVYRLNRTMNPNNVPSLTKYTPTYHIFGKVAYHISHTHAESFANQVTTMWSQQVFIRDEVLNTCSLRISMYSQTISWQHCLCFFQFSLLLRSLNFYICLEVWLILKSVC